MTPDALFRRPTSVFLCGGSRPLLNWTAFALALTTDPGFLWTNVALRGEVTDGEDPLARHPVPPERFGTVYANEMTSNESGAHLVNAARGSLIRSDEPPEVVRRLVDFLRLPTHTQEILAKVATGGPPTALVLSNAHRMVALYPGASVAPIVQTITEVGAILIVTWADAPPEGRTAFETVLHLHGYEVKAWRQASLRVEKSPADSGFHEGAAVRLADIPQVASTLARELG